MTANQESYYPKDTSDESDWANKDSLSRLLSIRQHYLNLEPSPEFANRTGAIIAAAELLVEEIVTTHPETITTGSQLEGQVKELLIKLHPRPGHKRIR